MSLPRVPIAAALAACAALALALGAVAQPTRPLARPGERPLDRPLDRPIARPAGPGLRFVRTLAVPSRAVGRDVELSVMIPPPRTVEAGTALPVVVVLADARSERRALAGLAGDLALAMQAGELAPAVVVVPEGGASLFADRADGGGNWQTFVSEELRGALAARFGVAVGERRIVLVGHLSGGAAALRIAFAAPTAFGAVGAVAPALLPAEYWSDLPADERALHLRLRPELEAIFGRPFDGDGRWSAGNPARVARATSTALRAAKLGIFLTVGTADDPGALPGTRFLHEALTREAIPHIFEELAGERRSLEFNLDGLHRAVATAVGLLP